MGAVEDAALCGRKHLEPGARGQVVVSPVLHLIPECELWTLWGSVSSSVKYMFWVSQVSEYKKSQFPIWVSASHVFFLKNDAKLVGH